MKTYVKCILLLVFPILALAQKKESSAYLSGKKNFESNCLACHGISNGNFGPKLGSVHETRPIEELVAFVKNSDAFVKKGDARTLALLDKYKNPMPGFEYLRDTEIKAIFEYIKTESVKLNEKALVVELKKAPKKRYAPAIKISNLFVELTDYLTFPKQENTPGDKGLATLRTTNTEPNSFFISDQMGLVYKVENQQPEVFFDIRKYRPAFVYSPGIGTGLGSFDFHPNYAENGLLYTTHAELFNGKTAINPNQWADTLGVGLQWVITEWKISELDSKNLEKNGREVLRFNTPTTAHGGQDLCFKPNAKPTDEDFGLLYLGIGDGGANNIKMPELGHNNTSILGTIIRIDPAGNNGRFDSYGIPPTNPFTKKTETNIQQEIYAFGFRNPHRFAWKGDNLLVADIGEANVEELNVAQKGGDYGWPSQEGGFGVATKIDKTVLFDISTEEQNKFIQPMAQYDHEDGKAVSGGFFYEGNIVALQGKYIFGDIVTGQLFYIEAADLNQPNEIFELNVIYKNTETTLKELAKLKRAHMRIGFNTLTHDLYVMTKNDQTIRKISKAYFK